MESIIYNISNAYFPVTVYLKEGASPGGATVDTNTHNFAGEYSFDDVVDGQYCIHVVDCLACEAFKNVPPLAGECDLDGTLECDIGAIKYGLLYNAPAASNPDITSSDEWIVPDLTAVTELFDYIDTFDGLEWPNAIGYLKETGTDHWTSPNTGATDVYNFTARGSGYRTYEGFDGINNEMGMWLTTPGDDPNTTYLISLVYDYAGTSSLFWDDNINGYIIRLVRPATVSELLLADGTYVDDYIGNDLTVYKAVKIGNQIWLAESLAETLLRDLTPIPEVTDNSAWNALETMALCAYNNDWDNVFN